jgi:hypothetical protein
VGDKKIPIALAIAIVMGAWSLHEWSDAHFVTRVYADSEDAKLAVKIEANGTLIKEHVSKYEINENKKAIALVQDQQFTLLQFENVNGKNTMTIRRTEELRRKLIDLNDIKICMQNGNGNCD